MERDMLLLSQEEVATLLRLPILGTCISLPMEGTPESAEGYPYCACLLRGFESTISTPRRNANSRGSGTVWCGLPLVSRTPPTWLRTSSRRLPSLAEPGRTLAMDLEHLDPVYGT